MAGQGMTELQKAWTAYLRANPQMQAEGCLRDVDGRMCCLGAAAQIMMDRNVVSGYEWAVLSNHVLYLRSLVPVVQLDTQVLPPDFWKALGLHDREGGFMNHGHYVSCDVDGKDCYSLADMNDCGVTWPQIADFIEANPHMVFANCGGGK